MKSSLWFEASMLALVLLISLMSVAVEQVVARNDPRRGASHAADAGSLSKSIVRERLEEGLQIALLLLAEIELWAQ